uniref:NADH dehydrogenase subunit 4L n=1 Tax=Leipothrix sp. 1 XFX-2017 TaxID=1955440 RepID=A0A1S5XVY7_9ACAR|nr:NADH dehydrogenase subunit 4L [Leipothrix sp. 1 XFX-2017]
MEQFLPYATVIFYLYLIQYFPFKLMVLLALEAMFLFMIFLSTKFMGGLSMCIFAFLTLSLFMVLDSALGLSLLSGVTRQSFFSSYRTESI